VSFEGEVKLCDFGIAHANEALGATKATDVDEALKGKAGYMSPEHARGEPLDARADVFAAGIVLWELAAGRRLYRVADEGETLLEQARKAEIPSLPDRGLPANSELRSILDRALAVDRDERYPSAAAMQRDLEGYAVRAKLTTSPLQLGDWLTATFGQDIVAQRRARERAAAALERGALVVLRPIGATAAPAPLAGPKSVGAPESDGAHRVAASGKLARRSSTALAVMAIVLVMALAVAIVALQAR
jgi:serine/threonine-protein kinase